MKKNYMNLQLFGDVTPVNVTTQDALSPTMKTFYNKTLLENARAVMVFTQFAKRVPMKGNKCEFRRFRTFAKAMTPLTEGVIPTGKTFGMDKIEVETTQHGDYTAISDRLELESYDDVIFGATEEMGAAEGATFDALTRNKIIAGTSVAYCPNGTTEVTSRTELTPNCILTPKMVHKARTWLKKNKVPTINGFYVALIHPSVAYDLRETDEWKEYHKHNDVTPIFKGEIGELHGVKFVETTEGKVHEKAGADNCSTYDTLFFGKDAYGVLDPAGEGMEMIVKPKGTIGGPLEQFSTVGYKFCHGAEILYQERIIRVESGSSFVDADEEN